MKTAAYKLSCRPIDHIPYPNAATRRQLLHRLLDVALLVASGIGIASMLLMLIVIF